MTSKETARHLALLALPALLLALAGAFNRSRAPLFQWSDPDYIYLLNALCLAEGAAPGHTDHPGTPLQVAGAVLLGGRHLATGRPFGSLREHVLREPEAFLALWREVHRALAALALAAGGALVLRVTRSLPSALLFQLLPLLSVQIVSSLCRVAPEPALLALGSAVCALTVALVRAPEWRTRRVAAALGALAGIGLATKVVFAPIALAPWAALDRRGRRTFAIVAGAALALGLLPIATRLPATAGWLLRVTTHTGQYGTGAVGLVDATRLPSSLSLLVREEWLTLALIGAAAVAGLLALRRKEAEDSLAARVLVATAGLQVVWLAMALRHFDRRYLVPAALLNGLQAVLLWQLERGHPTRSPRLHRAVVAGLVAAAIALAPLRLGEAAGAMRRTTLKRAQVAGFLERLGPAVEDSYVLSRPGALQLANAFARGRFGADLHRLYPSFVSWHGGGIQAFGERLPVVPLLHERPDGSMTLLALVADHSPVLAAPPPPFRPVPILRLPGHTLFEARLLPCDGAGGAFSGFVEAAGLRAVEGPYPQWGLARPVRWGLAPETRLWFVGASRAMSLEMAARHDTADTRPLRVWLTGVLLQRLELPPSRAFEERTVSFQARPGLNELRLQYGPRGAEEGLEVLFERLRLSCPAAPAVGG